MKTRWESVRFEVKGKEVVAVEGCPELEGMTGVLSGDGMAFFFGKYKEFYVANTAAGTIRKFSTADGTVLAADEEIDYEAISRSCAHGVGNARSKTVRYACMNRYDGFSSGLCAISWMLYPDGRYFADSDGFGMEDNDEVNVYAVIDTNLDVIEPFRPIEDVAAYLKEIRKREVNVYNLIIIDESGSMGSIRKEAVDSVNETLQTIRAAQKKHEGQKHYVTLVTFNDDVKTICDRVSADEVAELTSETYRPDCCTALYDAMGISMNALRKAVAEGDKVLVTVVTDGYENASKEYSGKAVKAMVDELKGKGWVFAYIGANQDVEAVAATMSITNAMSFESTSAGTRVMSMRLNRSRERIYDCMAAPEFSADEANTNFFDEEIS